MSVQTRTAALGRTSAWDRPRGPRGTGYPEATLSAEDARARRIDQVLRAVGSSFALNDIELPDEFFPAHLSVALVDAVFRFRPGDGERPSSPVERYCHRFGVARRRADVWELPNAGEQESLADLASHYDELGTDAMADEVSRSRYPIPGTSIGRAELVLDATHALRDIGVGVLQDIRARRPGDIEGVLGPLPGADEHFVRRLLMYTGDDDFVRGDAPVRSFVAHALGRKSIAAGQAVNLVRESAYELVVSPRYLDYRIWCHGVAPAR